MRMILFLNLGLIDLGQFGGHVVFTFRLLFLNFFMITW